MPPDWQSEDMQSRWRHQMEAFFALLALFAENSPVNSPHKGQWHGALMFSLICAWINGWVNNRKACDLRRHRHAHYDAIVMSIRPANQKTCWNWLLIKIITIKFITSSRICWYGDDNRGILTKQNETYIKGVRFRDENTELSLHAKFVQREQNMNLHFSFLHISMIQVVEILPQVIPGHTYSTKSISWLLMPWRRKGPWHEQPWYCPSLTEITRSPHVTNKGLS